MLTVKKVFNLPKNKIVQGEVGLEIEVEGHNLPRTRHYWREEEDGSLRGESCEYVLKKPLSLMGSMTAINYLDDLYKSTGTVVHESVRAGVHVHINVQDLSVIQLYNYLTAYIILEDLLVNYCGKYREGNLFCLRTKDADFLLHEMERAAQTGDFNRFGTDRLRYASVNVSALYKYGSLEFRSMRGTRDLDMIKYWIKLLHKLKHTTSQFLDPAAVVHTYKLDGVEGFLKLVLGDLYKSLIRGRDYKKYINDGFLRAYQMAVDTDWGKYNTKTIGGLEFPHDTEYPDEPMEDF